MFGLVTWCITLISWRQATETALDVWPQAGFMLIGSQLGIMFAFAQC
jgi:hypothetical protein